MRVASDIDNVLSDIIESARRTLAQDNGIPVNEIVLTGIYHDPFSHPDPSISPRMKVNRAFWDREDVLMGCDPIQGSVQAMHRLHRAGVLAGYVTRRPPSVAHLTKAWLEKHGYPDLPIHHVGAESSDASYDQCKSVACGVLGATHLIDDHATEIATAHAAGMEIVVVDAEIGRAARYAELARNPGHILARDAADAADILIDRLRMAA